MSVLASEIRPGAYADSIVLMQLQGALAKLPGILDAGVVMGTPSNLDLLAANDLLPEEVAGARPDDLVLVVRAESREVAAAALAEVERLMERPAAAAGDEFRPRSLASAAKLLPEASWVTVSVPGRYAAAVAREALALGKHVFLYSDNVSIDDERELKERAGAEGLLVLGPDCGTAVVGGVGLGFANRARRGAIGLVGASGTGLQAIAARIHAAGGGISHAIGTGGRDLAAEIGGATARQGLDLLARDPETAAIVLISKPPAPAVATRVLAAARAAGKPVVVCFLGQSPPARRLGSLAFAGGLAEAADLALEAAAGGAAAEAPPAARGALRGLFAGGTLAVEALRTLSAVVSPLSSNVAFPGVEPLPDPSRSRGHTVLDLGADEFTVGRPHPMIDQDLRLRRLRREAADPETGLIALDLVLGEGAHPDPAAELAPAIAEALAAREDLEVVVLVVGTDEDPQDLAAQRERLEAAGARVFDDLAVGLGWLAERLRPEAPEAPTAVPLEALAAPVAINVGLESFYASLVGQGARAIQVDWRPPAGGDERLQAILERMKSR